MPFDGLGRYFWSPFIPAVVGLSEIESSLITRKPTCWTLGTQAVDKFPNTNPVMVETAGVSDLPFVAQVVTGS